MKKPIAEPVKKRCYLYTYNPDLFKRIKMKALEMDMELVEYVDTVFEADLKTRKK